ncbi:MAG: Mrp/NBP35 family ATP-binding protein [Clostridia bacterium]|nr:Mrp/NBP35 family ATP-binding protein [Clostridia bacterium]
MAENCNHDCSSCSANCSSREKTSFLEEQNMYSNVKKIIAVISGKGGVGKSLITSMLAVKAAKEGKKVAILDADITGPSIPKAFGIREKAMSDGTFMYPCESSLGIKVMSVNLLLENEKDPVVWRGPVIAGLVKQFYKDVVWGDIDEMYVDCPPGTGDVPLTVFQSLPIDKAVVVSAPQGLVSMIVEKAVNMAKLMDVKLGGIVENMSYFKCDNCGEKHYIFGKSDIDSIAKEFGIENVVKVPINPDFANNVDQGLIETLDFEELDDFVKNL